MDNDFKYYKLATEAIDCLNITKIYDIISSDAWQGIKFDSASEITCMLRERAIEFLSNNTGYGCVSSGFWSFRSNAERDYLIIEIVIDSGEAGLEDYEDELSYSTIKEF